MLLNFLEVKLKRLDYVLSWFVVSCYFYCEYLRVIVWYLVEMKGIMLGKVESLDRCDLC